MELTKQAGQLAAVDQKAEEAAMANQPE